MPKSGKITIGITGEIGAGKTTYTKEFRNLGFLPVYTDKIAHEILKISEVKSLIRDYFGKDIIKKSEIDRKKLAFKAFRNKSNWKKLLELTHPCILKEIDKIIKCSANKYCAIDAPLLFESGLDKKCDFILLVKASPDIRRKRLLKKMSWQEAEKRTSCLMPIKDKLRLADFVVDNSKNEKGMVKKNVQEIWLGIQNKRSKTERRSV
ncbi:MAG TPA: dephospho-CoA kinase [Candidatus Omnitrophica bacterium]|nr:dephospho-CoA kinase [Candidatus Omnitrophota bacterium]